MDWNDVLDVLPGHGEPECLVRFSCRAKGIDSAFYAVGSYDYENGVWTGEGIDALEERDDCCLDAWLPLSPFVRW